MTITMYVCSDEPNKINKKPQNATSFTGSPRGEVSVLNPTFIVNAESLSGYNYFSAFGRYYYVTEISCIREGIWSVSGHVDVLKTYASEIGACQCIFSRAENKALYNLYLPDDRLTISSKRIITEKFIGEPLPTGEPSMILTVAG